MSGDGLRGHVSAALAWAALCFARIVAEEPTEDPAD